jgi:ribosomal-protein-alanine N-acetyltransferase
MNIVKLETERLILKGISSQDMKFLFDNFPKEEIMAVLGHQSNEAYLQEEQKHKQGYSAYNRKFLLFLLIDKASGKIIGRSGFHNWNEEHFRAEIGYRMEDETFKGKALMTEAVRAIIQYGFQKLQLNRIEALVGTENLPSIKIMEKFHFSTEGILKQHWRSGEAFTDTISYALLRSEYAQLNH